jgi:hypothetical protein
MSEGSITKLRHGDQRLRESFTFESRGISPLEAQNRGHRGVITSHGDAKRRRKEAIAATPPNS